MKRFQTTLPGRGDGLLQGLDFGPADRPVDIVFLHANGFNARTYRSILEPLASSLRIIAFDQRGHGLTSLAADTTDRSDWFDLRDDLLALLTVIGADKPVLSGHSMGGTVSMLATIADPASARALVLFDPVVMRPEPAPEAREAPMIQAALRRRSVFPSREAALQSYGGRGAFRTWPDVMLRDYVDDGFRDLPGGEVELTCSPAWEASGYLSQGHDSDAVVRRLTAKTAVFKAEDGSTFSVDSPEDLAPATVVEVVSGTTHFLPMERPDLVRRALAAATA